MIRLLFIDLRSDRTCTDLLYETVASLIFSTPCCPLFLYLQSKYTIETPKVGDKDNDEGDKDDDEDGDKDDDNADDDSNGGTGGAKNGGERRRTDVQHRAAGGADPVNGTEGGGSGDNNVRTCLHFLCLLSIRKVPRA